MHSPSASKEEIRRNMKEMGKERRTLWCRGAEGRGLVGLASSCMKISSPQRVLSGWLLNETVSHTNA